MTNIQIKDGNYFTFKFINSVIRILTISDLIILSGFGLVAPIFAIFITQSIVGGNIAVAGLSASVFLLAKSLAQIPFAIIIDKIKGEKDDFWVIFIGSLAYSLVPLLYIVISTPAQLYLVQFIYGLAIASTMPAWFAIFTRHIDRDREGTEWGIYQTLVGLGSAFAASIGGFLANNFGFHNLFLVVSITSFVGSFFLLGIYKNMRPRRVIKKKYGRK